MTAPTIEFRGEPTLAPMRDNRKVRDIDQAIDLYLDVLQTERGLTEASRSTYQWLLFKFARLYDADYAPWEITTEHCRLFLNQWRDASNATKAQHITTLRRFFAFLLDEGIIDENPMEKIRRPRRKRPEELDVVTVSSTDVGKLWAAVEDWDEFLCFALLTYSGPRRKAAATVRRQDVDLENRTIKFREKGNKSITKRAPEELLAIVREADAAGVWKSPGDWLIPNRREPRKKNERSPKVIYSIVKRVAKRAGVDVHPHALRAAFAVRYLEQHPGDLDALQKLLGHESTDTTRVYLRRQDDLAAMDRVTDLSWGAPRFKPKAVLPPTGFEPVLEDQPLDKHLQSKLVELRTHKRRKERA